MYFARIFTCTRHAYPGSQGYLYLRPIQKRDRYHTAWIKAQNANLSDIRQAIFSSTVKMEATTREDGHAQKKVLVGKLKRTVNVNEQDKCDFCALTFGTAFHPSLERFPTLREY